MTFCRMSAEDGEIKDSTSNKERSPLELAEMKTLLR